MDEKIRVLIVDDHTVVRKGLCSLLSAEKYGIEVVGEASDGRDAIAKAITLQPAVILLDLVMPGMGGLEGNSCHPTAGSGGAHPGIDQLCGRRASCRSDQFRCSGIYVEGCLARRAGEYDP